MLTCSSLTPSPQLDGTESSCLAPIESARPVPAELPAVLGRAHRVLSHLAASLAQLDELLLSLPLMARVQPVNGSASIQAVFLNPDCRVRVTLSLPFDAVLKGLEGDHVSPIITVEGSRGSERLTTTLEAAVAALPPGPTWLRSACLAVHGLVQCMEDAPFAFKLGENHKWPSAASSQAMDEGTLFGVEKRTLKRTPIKASS